MAKFGILFCAYNCSETVNQSILPWIAAREQKLGLHEYVISAVSVPFAEYKNIPIPVDHTQKLLKEYHVFGDINHLAIEPEFISEAEARNLALKPLLAAKVDTIILWDGDEVAGLAQISALIEAIILEPWCAWFSFSYKNFVFNNKTYLIQPFTPPRAFRTEVNGYKLCDFSWDNDMTYAKDDKGVYVKSSYLSFPTKIIPKHVAWISHYTWLNTPKTKAKIAYQNKHFNGICSYRWNEEKQCVEFNSDYYAKMSLPIPSLAAD